MANPLDQCNIGITSIVNVGTDTCTIRSPNYPTCTDLLDICFCRPTIDPPPDQSKCVNQITTTPWPTPPPIDAGCNPFSISITNRQDETASSNISLKGKVKYLGSDPCLPQLDLELITSPTFFRGGGSPNVRGWGISYYGGLYKICPENCPGCNYENPQDFFADVPGAITFIPENVNCDSVFDECRYKQVYGDQAPRFNLIGPMLAEIGSHTVWATYQNEPYAWKYTFSLANCVIAGNYCVLGCDVAPPWVNSSRLTNDGPYCYNIKENLDYSYSILTPGVDLTIVKPLGLKPQPLIAGTQVLVYGLVPWGRNGDNPDNCDCGIVWFVDVPNALAGECEDPAAQQSPAVSMIPTRSVTSAGQFYGVPSSENRV